jgi:hypothetical protein
LYIPWKIARLADEIEPGGFTLVGGVLPLAVALSETLG